MLGLAFEGITSLSTKPISMIVGLGFLVSALSFVGIIWAIITAFLGYVVAGWASMTCIVCFLGGFSCFVLELLENTLERHIWKRSTDHDILLVKEHMR